MSKTVIHFDAVDKTKKNASFASATPRQKKATSRDNGTNRSLLKNIFRKKEKEEKQKQERTITFAKRPFENKLTLVFWGLFVGIAVVLLMTFGRLDTLTRLANAKAVDKTALVTQVKSDLDRLESMDYQGVGFVKALITRKANDEGNKEWERTLTPYLANGLSATNLGFAQTNAEQTVQSVNFIKQAVLHTDKEIYRLSYEVTYTSDRKAITLDVSFPVSFQNDQIKVLASPSVSNQATISNKNNAKINERLLEVEGDPISSDEQQKIGEFMDNFFDLYARNDEKLSMISNMQGLQEATFDNQSVKTVVETKNHQLIVSGDYQIHFGEETTIHSPYQVTLKKAGQSYFVEEIQ